MNTALCYIVLNKVDHTLKVYSSQSSWNFKYILVTCLRNAKMCACHPMERCRCPLCVCGWYSECLRLKKTQCSKEYWDGSRQGFVFSVEPFKLKNLRHYNTLTWPQNAIIPFIRTWILKYYTRMPPDPLQKTNFRVPYLKPLSINSYILQQWDKFESWIGYVLVWYI